MTARGAGQGCDQSNEDLLLELLEVENDLQNARMPYRAGIKRRRDELKEQVLQRMAATREPTTQELDGLADVIDGEVGDERPQHVERCVWEYVRAALAAAPSSTADGRTG